LLLQHQCFGRSWSENITDSCREVSIFSWKFLVIISYTHTMSVLLCHTIWNRNGID
jgi:hypothetical protein